MKSEFRRFTVAAFCSMAIGGTPEALPTTADAGSVGPLSPPAKSGSVVAGHQTVNQSEAGIAPASNTDCGDPSYRAPRRTQIDSMLCRFNDARSESGLLVEDPALDATAQDKLKDIIDCQDFSHYACGNNPFEHLDHGPPPWIVGEDLAYGVQDWGGSHSIFGAWRKSPDHWQNIIDGRFTLVGLALKHVSYIATDEIIERNVTVWAAEFLGHN